MLDENLGFSIGQCFLVQYQWLYWQYGLWYGSISYG